MKLRSEQDGGGSGSSVGKPYKKSGSLWWMCKWRSPSNIRYNERGERERPGELANIHDKKKREKAREGEAKGRRVDSVLLHILTNIQVCQNESKHERVNANVKRLSHPADIYRTPNNSPRNRRLPRDVPDPISAILRT